MAVWVLSLKGEAAAAVVLMCLSLRSCTSKVNPCVQGATSLPTGLTAASVFVGVLEETWGTGSSGDHSSW